MRFSTIAAIVGCSSFALAQTQLLPKCAQSCVGTDFGGCGTLDVQCICTNKSLISGLACCVSTSCDEADQQTVIAFAQNLCKPQGVTDLPTSATCASGASSATGSASSTGGSSSASTTGSAASATGSAASSAAAAASSASAASSAAGSAPTGGAAMCKGSAAGMGFGLVLAGLMGAL
ncbi:cfem domain [Diplodia corticola]|uniref:Cfem domain n=1 Tax=Diplodia corticola TaxID=236234 RepID=A0A1J9QWN8_9PEZI|nr:cfem domain [Diplodia corticola]OJD32801.1 cfem domain [Diplodia corticola]